VASDLAIRAIRKAWASERLLDVADQWLERGTPDAKKQLLDVVRAGVASAHDAILAEAVRDDTKSGMGTTLVGAMVVGGELVFAHAGDSRAYLVRDGISMQLTEDHTLLARLLAAGIDVDVSGEGSRFRSMLTNALGIGEECKVSTFIVPLADGDRFLLCSDGISEYVPENEVGEVLSKQSSPARAAQRLIDLALERGGGDNATAVVVRVLEAGETPLPAEQRKKDDLAIGACPLWGKRTTPQQRLRALRIAIPRDHNFGEKLPPHALGDRVAWIIIEGELVQDGVKLGPGALVYPESLVHFGDGAPQPDRDALAITRSDVRALAIRADDFRELCDDDGELGETLLESLAMLVAKRRKRVSASASAIDPRGTTDPHLRPVGRAEVEASRPTEPDLKAIPEERERAATVPDDGRVRRSWPPIESPVISPAPPRAPPPHAPSRPSPPPPRMAKTTTEPPSRPSPLPERLARSTPPSGQAAVPSRPTPPPQPRAAARPTPPPGPPGSSGPSGPSGSSGPPSRPTPPRLPPPPLAQAPEPGPPVHRASQPPSPPTPEPAPRAHRASQPPSPPTPEPAPRAHRASQPPSPPTPEPAPRAHRASQPPSPPTPEPAPRAHRASQPPSPPTPEPAPRAHRASQPPARPSPPPERISSRSMPPPVPPARPTPPSPPQPSSQAAALSSSQAASSQAAVPPAQAAQPPTRPTPPPKGFAPVLLPPDEDPDSDDSDRAPTAPIDDTPMASQPAPRAAREAGTPRVRTPSRPPTDPEIETYLEIEADLPPDSGADPDLESELALNIALSGDLEAVAESVHESVSITIEEGRTRVTETVTETDSHTLTLTVTEPVADFEAVRPRAITADDAHAVSGTISIPEERPHRRARAGSEGRDD
jgi:PPM family protein phosphatase